MPPIEVNRPTGEPLIMVEFIKDKIYELNQSGKHGSNPTQDRIVMNVKNRSGNSRMEVDGEEGQTDQNFDGFTRCTPMLDYSDDTNICIKVAVHFKTDQDGIKIKIVYNFAPGSNIVRFDIDDGCHGVEQQQGACAFSAGRVIPQTCLQFNAFLWEGNNYGCYKNYKESHVTENIWFCKPCAKPGRPGMFQPCPLHDEYYNSLDEPLKPVH